MKEGLNFKFKFLEYKRFVYYIILIILCYLFIVFEVILLFDLLGFFGNMLNFFFLIR